MLLFTKIFKQFEWERFSSGILHSIIPCMHNLTQFVVGFELHREAVNRFFFSGSLWVECSTMYPRYFSSLPIINLSYLSGKKGRENRERGCRREVNKTQRHQCEFTPRRIPDAILCSIRWSVICIIGRVLPKEIGRRYTGLLAENGTGVNTCDTRITWPPGRHCMLDICPCLTVCWRSTGVRTNLFHSGGG